MYSIDFNSYYASRASLYSVSERLLEEKNVFIIKNFPPDVRLMEEYACALGTPSRVERSEGEASSIVQDVTEYQTAKKDAYGYEIFSTTNKFFPLHTDQYCNKECCDYVGLHCSTASQEGGESIFITVDGILSSLNAEAIASLQNPAFASPFGGRPILSKDEQGRFNIKYNMKDILHCQETGSYRMGKNIVSLLEDFEAIVHGQAQQVKLEENDLLMMHNKKCLHGRQPFPSGQKRLLRRFRVFKNTL